MRVAANLMQKLAGIQDQSFDSFTHILERAMQSDMPKLLTCCEYHIAADPLHRFHPVASRLGHVLPLSSFYRIAEGLSIGFENMAARSLLSERRCGYCMQSNLLEGGCLHICSWLSRQRQEMCPRIACKVPAGTPRLSADGAALRSQQLAYP